MKVENLTELLAWKPPNIPMIIGEGILHPETRLIMYGEMGTWKSMMAMHLAFCMCDGNSWLSHKTSSSKVLIIQTEIPKALYRERIIKYIQHNPVTNINAIYFITDLGIRLDTPYGVAALEEVMSKIQPRVCIIDPIYKAMGGDISSSTDVQKIQDNIDLVMHRYQSAIVIIAHENKGLIDASTGEKINRGASKIMGSSYWQDWVDSIACISNTGPDKVYISWEKTRNAQDIVNDEEVYIDRRTLRFTTLRVVKEEP